MNLSYFLGANSYYGFSSLYDGFVRSPQISRLYLLKGGAGCGKSSFMKKIASAAEAAGLEVERVFCSGDPQSLDGIFIPALRLAYVDATAPHAAVSNRAKKLELRTNSAIMIPFRQKAGSFSRKS